MDCGEMILCISMANSSRADHVHSTSAFFSAFDIRFYATMYLHGCVHEYSVLRT